MLAPRPQVGAHWTPGPPCRDAAERGLQTLRAPRYDLPVPLVLALVLAHGPPYFPLVQVPPPFPRVLGDSFFFIHWLARLTS